MNANTRNIVLIGMPASGKTSIGREIANKMNWDFYDSDEEIKKERGVTPGEIISTEGEEAFRKIEKEMYKKLLIIPNSVISLGGGSVHHCELLKECNSVICYIKRPFLHIYNSLKDEDNRPLCKTMEDVRRLYMTRKHLYKELSHFSVFNNTDIEKCADEIIRMARPHLQFRIAIIDGPNLNMLGIREPEIYGGETLEDRRKLTEEYAGSKGIAVTEFQSNYEGAIVSRIQNAHFKCDGIVINPAALTHYSYAVLDALKAVSVPAVEVHISDIDTREEFRKISVTAPACKKQIVGKGFEGYVEAIQYLIDNYME